MGSQTKPGERVEKIDAALAAVWAGRSAGGWRAILAWLWPISALGCIVIYVVSGLEPFMWVGGPLSVAFLYRAFPARNDQAVRDEHL